MLSILSHSHNFSKKISFTDISNEITDNVKELVKLVHSINHDEFEMFKIGCIRVSSNTLKNVEESNLFNRIYDLAEKIPQTDLCESYHQMLIDRVECFYERHFAQHIDEDDFNISSKSLISDLNYFTKFNKDED